MKQKVGLVLWSIVLCGIILSACANKSTQEHYDSLREVSEVRQLKVDTVQWIKSTEPINGYDVLIRACYSFAFTDYYCILTVNIEKDGKCYSVTLPGSYDSFHQNTYSADTFCFEPPLVDGTNRLLYLNYQVVASFADVNFDGENELIICSSPRPYRELNNLLDCESFTIFKITDDSLVQLHNMVFNNLELGECRTEYKFDTINKTLTLIGYHNAYDTSTEMYWFKNGEPYQLDYKYKYSYRGNDPRQCDSVLFQFKLPEDKEKHTHVMDSIYHLV